VSVPVPPYETSTTLPFHDPVVILPESITIPFIVFTDDGAVIAPVDIKLPFIVTSPDAKDMRSGSVVPNPISPLLFKSTPPIKPEPVTSKA